MQPETKSEGKALIHEYYAVDGNTWNDVDSILRRLMAMLQ